MEKQIQMIKDLIRNKDFKKGYQLLSQIDQDNLYVKGKYELLEKLYLELIDYIIEPSIKAKLGRVLYRQKKYIDAERYLKEAALTESKWLPFTYSVLGGMYEELGRTTEAKETLEKSIAKSNEYKEIQTAAGTNVRLAKLQLREGRDKEAEALILESINLAGENNWERDMHIWQGHLTQVLIAQGRSEEAKKILDKILPYFVQNEDVKYRDMFNERLESLQ